MLRPPQRLISFVLLLSLLTSLLPSTPSSSSVTAAPLAVEPQKHLPHIPRPDQAKSSSLPETAVSTMRDLHGETQTASGAVDGTYAQESIENTHVYPGVINGATQVSPREWYVVHEAPAGPFTHDALTFDYWAEFGSGSGGFNVHAYLSVWDPAGGKWGQEYELKRTSFAFLQTDTELKEADARLSLGLVPARAPVHIRLRCVNTRDVGTVKRCQMSNLRFANKVPNWLRYGVVGDGGNTIEEPGRLWDFRVATTSFDAGISPQTTPFFSVNLDHAKPYIRSIFKYRSQLIQLPAATDANRFSASMRYAQSITTPGAQAGQTQISFVPQDGTPPSTLIIVPDTTISTNWHPIETAPDKGIKGSTFSNKLGWLEITKWPGSDDHVFALDNIQIYLDGKPIPLPPDQLLGKCRCTEGGIAQHTFGDPVNTYSGAYYLQATDLTAPSGGPPLTFERSYASLFADPARYPTTTLGPGWRHAFAEQLVMSGTGSETNTIIYEAATGNRLRFYRDPEGRLSAAPGVRATLEHVTDPLLQQQVYVLRSSDQWLKIFDVTTGQLIERRDAGGHRQILTYYPASGQIEDGQVQNVSTLTPKQAVERTLHFTYGNYNGPRLVAVEQVPDATTTQQKRIAFSYTPSGALASITELHGGTTEYTYKQGTFLLEGVIDPFDTQVLTNTYDDKNRVGKQVEHTGRTTTYAYAVAGGARTTTIQQWPTPALQGPASDILVDHYRADGTLEYQTRNGVFQRYLTFDNSLMPAVQVDGGGTTTKITTNSSGLPTRIAAVLNKDTDLTTTVRYDVDNRPLELVSPDGLTTSLTYDEHGNLTRSLVQGPDGLQRTSIYTYTVDNRLQAERRPDGVVTSYTYNALGQVIRTIVNEQIGGVDLNQPDKHRVTEYGYDSFGRLITTTVGVGTPLARTDTTSYNADDTIAQTIQNYKNGQFDPDHPDEDIVTTYGYDLLGRQIFVTDVLGHSNVTIYTPTGQVATTIRNCYDAGHTPATTGCAPFDPAFPDRNVATRYSYDHLGRTAFITETGLLTGTLNVATQTFSAATERTTHIEYDQLSRPVTTTLNYQPTQPTYDPTTGSGHPDVNLQELSYYDGAGNVTWQRDTLGRWTHTQYDALNRPVRTIANYDDGDPSTTPSWANGSATDLITEQEYRSDGQLARRIDNAIKGYFSVSDPAADRITTYQYDTLGRPTTTIQNVLLGSTRTDTNRDSTTRYEPQTGRVQGQQDALGQWLRYHYDALSRVTATIQNCRTTVDGSSPPNDCTDTSKPTERNVRSLTRYDALGHIIETEDALGHIMHTDYDGLGRVVATTANYVSGVAPDADTNVTTRTEYDALGRVVAVTDPTGAVTGTEYDALGRVVAVTDAARRVTRHGYEGSGTRRWTMSHDGRLTVFQVDGLSRVVTTIANYHNGTAEAADGADRDVITTTSYDAAGRTIETTETTRQIVAAASGRRTAFRYDLRDQLTQVIENYHPDCSTLPAAQQPCNVTTTYTYDRAGNRTAITDALNHTRTMVYDAADRLTEERDALNRATGWEYNLRDQPTRKRDPRGSAYDVIYTYDELGRRTGTSAPQLDAPITEQYDALGRRTQMEDGTGTTSFQYDDLSRVTSVQQPGGTVGYRYTARGERSELRYPSGATVAYTYTVDGQLQSVQEGATALAHYSYDGVGRLAQVGRANGTLTTYAYDGLDRLFDLTTRVQGELRSRYQYTIDRTGLRTAVTETFPPDTSGQSVLIQSTGSNTVQPSPSRSLHQLAFVPNRGQTDGRVAFVARHQGGTVFVTPHGLTLALPVAASGASPSVDDEAASTASGLPRDRRQTATRIEWVRANPRPTLTPDQALPGTVNDLRGSTPTRWQRNLPTYGGVTYTGLYDGIDLHYDGTTGVLKGTYTVGPGADPKQIRWRYAGAKTVHLTDAGDLQVHLAVPADQPAPILTEAAPIAWQDGPSGRTPVTVAYTVDQHGSVGFVLGTYDAARPLTIDPTLTWSTTLSGSSSEEGRGIAVASDGTLVITGATTSADFPQTLGVQPAGHQGGYDAFVTKLSADGTQVLWQTFLGGSRSDWGHSLDLDDQGRPVIVGMTASDNLLTTPTAVQSSFGGGTCAGVPCFDAFIARLSADGSSLQYSSYLGGSKQDQAQRVALASDGSAVLVGETASSTFPTTAGAWQTVPGEATCETGSPCTDAFITRIDLGAATGAQALRWSTRLGGADTDSAWGVTVDSAGDVLVTGVTESANLPLANAYDPHLGGMSDAFVAKLSGDGTQVRWGTYLGSTDTDVGRAVAVDGTGDVLVTGWTASPSFPTTPGSLQPGLAGASDAFVTKLSSDGTRLRWSTFVGGSDDDQSYSLTVEADGTSTLAGWTASSDLPTVRPLQANHAGPTGGQDLLVAALAPDGRAAHLVSYLGSSSSDERAWDMAVAESGTVRVTGYTGSANFPGGSPPPGSTSNAFVVALDGLTTPDGEPAVEQRAVSYGYDSLQRLTEATETPGTAYRYTYDLVGNRTQVWIDGTPQPARTYDAANQVVGWSYDATGNLLSDGTRTLTYDALSRLISAAASGTTTSYRYNGDGVLASQTTNSATTSYTQDLVAPLSQVLEQSAGSTTTSYRYGQERLAEVQGSTRTWYGTDALGSMRQTLSDSGTASAPIHYDAWGTPTQGTPPMFGFTGELQEAGSGLVHLRARWYIPGHGTFASHDPFAGFSELPYSLHPYQYGYSNPVLNTDPSGQVICSGSAVCPPGLAGGGSCPIAYAWDEQRQACVRRSWVPSFLPETTNRSIDPGIGPAAVRGGRPAVEVGKEVILSSEQQFIKSCVELFSVQVAQWLAPATEPSPLPEPSPAPQQPSPTPDNDQYITVYRFANRNDPQSLRSNLSRLSPQYRDSMLEELARSKSYNAHKQEPQRYGGKLGRLAKEHATLGAPIDSPFVSVLLDHSRGAATTDPCLQAIIWGDPSVAYSGDGKECRRAPDLGVFRVPVHRLVNPNNSLSSAETELLFYGDDLERYLVQWTTNPYVGPHPNP